MSIVPPSPGEPRRPEGPKDPGDAWVVADDGTKYWGRFGAAGLLAVDDARGVLLQQRVGWSHFGGTWGTPGGALHQGESAIDGAIRESQEEAGVPDGSVRPLFTSVYSVDIWSYTTLVAVVDEPFEATITDPESVALEWVPPREVLQRELHPGFAASWPLLREALTIRPVIVVDVANVMGSTPDGWWKDRAGAAGRVLERLAVIADRGVSSEALGLPATRWFPTIIAVLEGESRVAAGRFGDIAVVRAEASGDDAIVDAVASAVRGAGAIVHVVTSDRELRERVEALGARVHGVRWLDELG